MYIRRLVLVPSLLHTVRRRSLSQDKCTRLFALDLKNSTAFATVECMIRVEVVYCVAKQYQKSFSRMFKFSL